jgi:cellobiose phosphorylase
MRYGFFDEENREYVITRPDTPTPWINYLGQNEYCAIISNTAGGYSFHKDPRDRRITRYRYNNLPMDRPGRYLYLRDRHSGDFWSLTWQPTKEDPAKYRHQCRHGLGYTRISSSFKGIDSDITYFVPLGENLEVWLLNLKNRTKGSRAFSLFTYLEFCLWQAVMDMQDFQYSLNISRAQYQGNTIFHLTNYYPQAGLDTLAFFAASQRPCGFDTDRECFLGKYRDESTPLAVERGESFDSINHGGNPIASLHLKFKLPPRTEKDLVFVLGVSSHKKEAARKAKEYTDLDHCRDKLCQLRKKWDDSLGSLKVSTPDGHLDTMLNVWNQYQCRTTFNWARSASFYESGIGRGMGFRDANQDTLGVLHSSSAAVKQRIRDLIKNQFKRGDSFHQYFPLTKAGDKTGYSDDHLWLIVSVCNYIKESGDFSFLEEILPFADKGKASVYRHLLGALDYSYGNCGRHGLPYLGYADWNDCLNNAGKEAESVWVAQLLCYVTAELARLAEYAGRSRDSSRLNRLYRAMAATVNRVAWDGSWYRRIFDFKGRPVGSRRCREGGRIYLNTQTWAVLSSVADKARALKCMDAVRRSLFTEHGIKLMHPAYRTFYPYIGAIGTFSPGLKENGGIFCHANPWAVIAETMLGRGEMAFEYYKLTCPAARNDLVDTQKTEPYVYSQFIAGDESPEFGRSRNSWLTGSASWNLIAAVWFILGIRPDYEGLIVDPCIPKGWDSFRIERVFRGCRYHIEVFNPRHLSRGIASIELDGSPMGGQVLPVIQGKKKCCAKIIIG